MSTRARPGKKAKKQPVSWPESGPTSPLQDTFHRDTPDSWKLREGYKNEPNEDGGINSPLSENKQISEGGDTNTYLFVFGERVGGYPLSLPSCLSPTVTRAGEDSRTTKTYIFGNVIFSMSQ